MRFAIAIAAFLAASPAFSKEVKGAKGKTGMTKLAKTGLDLALTKATVPGQGD